MSRCFFLKKRREQTENSRPVNFVSDPEVQRVAGTPDRHISFDSKSINCAFKPELNSFRDTQDLTVGLSSNLVSFENALSLVDVGFLPHCSNAKILSSSDSKSNRQVVLLRDSGCLQTLISKEMIARDEYLETGETRLIRGVTGEPQAIPLVEINVETKFCAGKILVGLVESISNGISILLGNDYDPSPGNNPVDSLIVTRSQAEALNSAEHSNDLVNDNDTDLNLNSLFEEESPAIDLSNIAALSKDDLITAQQNDSELIPLFNLVDDEIMTRSGYSLKGNVLIRYYFEPGCPLEEGLSVTQIVVPKVLRRKILELAHDIPASGHLGMAKTLDRIRNHFYWPGINRDVKTYVRTCDICQKLGKGGRKMFAPLQSLPIMGEAFQRVAIDIVGPLPTCEKSGNRFLLTIFDLCTHYPNAIPLVSHDAISVVNALNCVFSLFGFPKELLSDRGTEFLGDVMQIFLDRFSIAHIKTSAYRPQTNASCERFHRCLKDMMRSVMDQFPQNWDDAIPWVLFAFREVPVEGLGFSPFDLMFGRQVVGPLSLMKGQWIEDPNLMSVVSKKHVIDFVLDLRERIKTSIDASMVVYEQQQGKIKALFDRKSQDIEYQVGQLVLILIPIPGNPLSAKLHGPYKVLSRLGPVDYMIETPDRRKTKRVCHVNLLRPYHSRESCSNFLVDPLPTKSVLSFSDQLKDRLNHLPLTEHDTILAVLNEFKDVFSDKPGKTTAFHHHIELKAGSKAYR
jgi:hypothetical protein